MNEKTLVVALLALAGGIVRADYTVSCEQFYVSKAVSGKGEVSVACAAVGRRFSTSAGKHFFGMRTPAPFAFDVPVGGNGLVFTAACGIDRDGADGRIVMKLFGDGRELWTSDPIGKDAAKDIPVSVEVKDVKTLTFVSDLVEGLADGVGAVWGEA